MAARALGLDAELRRVAAGKNDARELRLNGRETSSLIVTFTLDTDVARIAEYSALIARNAHTQTHGAYVALGRGESDLILVAREPSVEEIRFFEQQKIALDIRPVALDALVFIVNADNAINALSLQQLRDIYTQKTRKWNEVGGRREEIHAITRDRNSGSEELMRELVMENRPVIEGGDRFVIHSMIGTLDAVESDENSLAYAVYYYERVMHPRATIKALAVEGVLPSRQTIADRTYPLVEPVYIVTRKNIAPDGPTAILRDWLLSNEGQKLVAKSGYVPIRADGLGAVRRVPTWF